MRTKIFISFLHHQAMSNNNILWPTMHYTVFTHGGIILYAKCGNGFPQIFIIWINE